MTMLLETDKSSVQYKIRVDCTSFEHELTNYIKIKTVINIILHNITFKNGLFAINYYVS